jgi:hypothetical protein
MHAREEGAVVLLWRRERCATPPERMEDYGRRTSGGRKRTGAVDPAGRGRKPVVSPQRGPTRFLVPLCEHRRHSFM